VDLVAGFDLAMIPRRIGIPAQLQRINHPFPRYRGGFRAPLRVAANRGGFDPGLVDLNYCPVSEWIIGGGNKTAPMLRRRIRQRRGARMIILFNPLARNALRKNRLAAAGCYAGCYGGGCVTRSGGRPRRASIEATEGSVDIIWEPMLRMLQRRSMGMRGRGDGLQKSDGGFRVRGSGWKGRSSLLLNPEP
jgi:hypothetical protein